MLPCLLVPSWGMALQPHQNSWRPDAIAPSRPLLWGPGREGGRREGWDRLGGDIDWDGDTSIYYTTIEQAKQKPNILAKHQLMRTQQSLERPYKAPKDYTKPQQTKQSLKRQDKNFKNQKNM